MTRALVGLPVLLLALVATSPAHAEGEVGRARALYEEAGQLEAENRWLEAQSRLREAIALHPTANLHYALGWAYENGSQPTEARGEYERAAALAERTDNGEVFRLAKERLRDLRERVPRESRGLAALGAAEDARASRKSEVLPWALLGGGGALVVTAVVLLASSAADASRRDDATTAWCAETACRNGSIATIPESSSAAALRSDASASASRGNLKQALGFTFGGVGLVSAGVGAYLLFRDGRSNESRDHADLHVDASILPIGGLAAASASATIRF